MLTKGATATIDLRRYGVAATDSCVPNSVAGSRVLVSCHDIGSFLVDLTRERRIEIALLRDAPPTVSAYRPTFTSLGRHWVVGRAATTRGSQPFYVDWRTGNWHWHNQLSSGGDRYHAKGAVWPGDAGHVTSVREMHGKR